MPLGGRSLVLNTMPPDGSDEQLISSESSVRLPAVTSPKAASKSDRDIRLLYQGSPLRPDVRPAIPRRTVGSGDMSRLMKDLPQDDGTAWAQLTGRIDDLQRQLAASDGRSTAILSRLEERLTKAQMREAAAMQHEGHGMKLMAVTMRSSGDMKPGQYVKGSTLKVEGQLSSLDARLHQLQSMMNQDVRQLSDTITKGQMAASNRIRVLEVQVEQMLASTGQQVKKDIAQAIAQERGVSAAEDQAMVMGDQTAPETQNAAKLIEARFSQLAARLEASEAARARLEEQVATLQLQQQGGPQAANIAPMGNDKLEELVRSLLGRIAVLEALASPTAAMPPAAVPAVQVAAAAPAVKEQVQADPTSDAALVADPQVTVLKPEPDQVAEAVPKAVQQAAVETAPQASKGNTEAQAPDNVPQESKQSVVTSADVVESMVPIGEAGLAAGGQAAGGEAEVAAAVVIAAEAAGAAVVTGAGAAEAKVADVAGAQKGEPAGNGLVQSQQVEGQEEEEEEDEGEDDEDEGEEEEGEESDEEEEEEEEEEEDTMAQQQQQQQQSAAHAVATSAEKEEEEEGEDEGEDEEEEEEGEDEEEDDEEEEQVVQQLQQQQQQQQQLHQQQEQRPAAHVVAAPANGEEEEEEGEDEEDEGEEEEEEGEEEEDEEGEESSVVTQKK